MFRVDGYVTGLKEPHQKYLTAEGESEARWYFHKFAQRTLQIDKVKYQRNANFTHKVAELNKLQDF
jgi:hypothetical protein